MIGYDEVERLVAALSPAPCMIAIDGRPLSGKSTTAAKLQARFGFAMLAYDDFFAGEDSWSGREPAYPYPFFRHGAFVEAICALKRKGVCEYYPFDWEAGAVSNELRRVAFDRPLIIEGCAVLDEELASLYDLRFWIESDPETTYPAAMARDGTHWQQEWRKMFLPSVELYLRTKPQARADYIVAGRGIGIDGKP